MTQIILGDLGERNPETLPFMNLLVETFLQPPVGWMQHAELCTQEQRACPRPFPKAVTMWSCSRVRMPGAHSALTRVLGIRTFPWRRTDVRKYQVS